MLGSYLSGKETESLRGRLPQTHPTQSPATPNPPTLYPTQRSQASTNFVSCNLHLNRSCNVPCLLPLALSCPIILPRSTSTKKGDGSKFHRVDGTAVMTASPRKRALCDSISETNNKMLVHIKIMFTCFVWICNLDSYL